MITSLVDKIRRSLSVGVSFDTAEIVRRALTFDVSKLPDYNADTRLDFDLDYLKSVAEKLSRLNRVEVLASIAQQLRKGQSSELDAFKNLVFFCQAASRNFMSRQPVHNNTDHLMVSDPILLLAMNEMRCGHVSRVVCDIANAMEWRSRLVQLGGHVAAEVRVDGRWLLVDADLFGGGVLPTLPDGSYGSFEELAHCPHQLDIPFSNIESTLFQPGYVNDNPRRFSYPSFFYFSRKAYGTLVPTYYEKNTALSPDRDEYFGWHDYSIEEERSIPLTDEEVRWMPPAPEICALSVEDQCLKLQWEDCQSTSYQLMDYQVIFTRSSRGWNYPKYFGKPEMQKHWVAPRPLNEAAYRAAQFTHAADVLVSANTTGIEVPSSDLQGCGFVTVMPRDAYGVSVGRTRWSMSPEYALPASER